jgi:hypothetical protein
LAVLLLLFAAPSMAQEENLEMAVLLDDLPTVRHLAAAVSDPASRFDSLLTMIAVARMLEGVPGLEQDPAGSAEARFRDDRAWLDRLAAHYIVLPMRDTVLDPAAWLILQELDQHGLSPGPLASPLGPGFDVLLAQLFDRSNERLASAMLPALLARIEPLSTPVWQILLEQAAANGSLLALVSALNVDWFDPWMAAEPPAPAGDTDSDDLIGESLESFKVLASSVMQEDPPDALRLKRLRFSLLSALPEMEDRQRAEASRLLRLAGAVDGLHEGRYLNFTEILLWVVADLLSQYGLTDETEKRMHRALVELLPRFSNVFARNFSDVDPRINTNLAAAFDIVQNLMAGQLDPTRLTALRQELSDAVAQLVLLAPDMGFYFDQPVRRRIAEEIDICTSIAANSNPDGSSALTREQFDGCLAGIVRLAGEEALSAELAGDPDGPFGSEQLRRELELPPWQRINYLLGYLHDRHPTACQAPVQSLPNPLEWSVLATLMTWFAQQAPVYFQTPENETLIVQMRQQGMALLHALEQQVDCISGAGGGLDDPVSRSVADYRTSLDVLVAGIRKAEINFRSERLAAGADVVLSGDATQRTAYRSEDLMISPCDPELVCEMEDELEATRALIGLFPDEFLIADQTGLGKIEICYDNMQWVERRAEPIRPGDKHVANYYGYLSFDLIGRFRENEKVTSVFGSRFVSPNEYHYLFAAATDEVLEDSCPTEWVGSKIVTQMENGRRIRVIPARLAYRAAARSRPSQVVTSNWNRGAEWRDWFVTGLGVESYEYPSDETIAGRVNQHLQTLYQAEQAMLYSALLRPPGRGGNRAGDSLFALMNEVTTRKALLRTQMILFYPDFFLDSDAIRAAMEGHGGLLDGPVLRRFQDEKVAVETINDIGVARLEQFRTDWSRQPEAVRRLGSVANSVAHALTRLNVLYEVFFANPPEPPATPRMEGMPLEG